ncbi:NADH-quinone oxidoreductase subunit NuoE [Oceanibaculum pacificum]|uniref:NADH dehydrogenase n=1 Tax=Oceanibaculum pacificum TaxID=580166 RepID=A0A154W8K5_9PROT|nr:NADH-quinone oxidoreductase subunit NuoE [Oceanibaculum pacificum]KZD09864.1 NADH dehydrogenase [Oceanibaculum pacificum]
MSGGAPAQNFVQPDSFAFTAENQAKVEKIIAKYPAGRQLSAVLPLLDLAQRQHDNWVPQAAMEHIAGILGVAPMRVMEVATFYTMFHLEPVGKYHLQLCTTTPCWLRGSDAVVSACRSKLGIDFGQVTEDGKFSMVEVECLGACVNAPILQVNDDFYEDMDGASTETLLDKLSRDEVPPAGSIIGRQTSAPEGGPTTLIKKTDASGSDGAKV